jgi:uncharacterized protein
MLKKELLLIFYKNPVKGKVKTRLAATMGEEKALDIYLYMTRITQNLTIPINVNKAVYFSDRIENATDLWPQPVFHHFLQHGNTLGDKMFNAFKNGFEEGYSSICIIGTDCLEITPNIVESAFHQLTKTDVVLGLAKDGGYYLLGMKSLHEALFLEKAWSTHTVGHDTLQSILKLGLSYALLPMLQDVDTEADLKKMRF